MPRESERGWKHLPLYLVLAPAAAAALQSFDYYNNYVARALFTNNRTSRKPRPEKPPIPRFGE